MDFKVQTSFRLHEETLERIDAMVNNPPGWLNEVGIGKVQDRTDVVERLVKHAFSQMPTPIPADVELTTKHGKQRPTSRTKQRGPTRNQ